MSVTQREYLFSVKIMKKPVQKRTSFYLLSFLFAGLFDNRRLSFVVVGFATAASATTAPVTARLLLAARDLPDPPGRRGGLMIAVTLFLGRLACVQLGLSLQDFLHLAQSVDNVRNAGLDLFLQLSSSK